MSDVIHAISEAHRPADLRHYGVEVAAVVANFVVCTVLAGKIFRWE